MDKAIKKSERLRLVESTRIAAKKADAFAGLKPIFVGAQPRFFSPNKAISDGG